MIALPTLRRAVWLTAGALAAGQLLLAWRTGHMGADLSSPAATVKGIASIAVVIALVVMLSGGSRRAKHIGKGVRMTHRAAKFAVKRAKKWTVLHVVVGGYACLCLLTGLVSNTWFVLTGEGHWLGLASSFTAFGRLGSVAIGIVAVLAAGAVAVYAANKQLDKRKSRDVHERTVAEILRPTVQEVAKAGLLVEPGSAEEAIRVWLGDADLTDKVFGIPRVVTRSLYLPDTPTSRKSVGYGVLGLPGAAKWVNTVANLQMRADGRPLRGGDGYGAGFVGSQLAISNKLSILNSFAWRRELLRAAYRDATGVEPDDAQIAEWGLSIYDPTGMVADRPEYAPFVKGYSPLAGVTDGTSARTLAQSLLVKDTNMTNSGYFDDSATKLITGLLLAAARAGHGMRHVHQWVSTLQDANLQAQVVREIAVALTGDNATADDAHIYHEWVADYSRTKAAPGERSAVWGTVQRALAPFSDPRVIQSTEPAGTGHVGGMVDMGKAITTPYAMTFVLLPGSADACANARPVVQAFLAALMREAVTLAEQFSNPEGLKRPLLIVADELPSTRILPDLRQYLDTIRAWNIRIVWIGQTRPGMEGAYGDAAKAIISTGTAMLTYANYGSVGDGHLEEIVRQIGQHQTMKMSTSRSKGKDGGESVNESQERVQAITVDRLRSDLEPDEIILQVNGTAGGKLRPFIIRQNRAIADESWVNAGHWVDPVLRARMVDGTAAGVVSRGRPARNKRLRPFQRLVWAISERWVRRGRKSEKVDVPVSVTEPTPDGDRKPVDITKPTPPITTDCRW